MPDERDQTFARDVFNASLTLMSILVVVITFLALYKLRPVRGGTPLAVAFGVLIAAMMAGIFYFGLSLIASPWG